MRNIISILFLIISFNSYSQYDIVSSFNSVHIGRNINLGINRNISDFSVSIALKCQINSFVTDDQNEVFKKRFFAVDFLEHFGLNIDIQYNINLKQSAITPFVFYNMQLTKSHTRNTGYLAYDIDTISNTILYRKYLEFWGPTIALENYIGIGYKVDLNNQMYISNKIGCGIISYFNVDKTLYGDGGNWELGYMINIGIGYRIQNGKRKKSP